MTWGQRKNYWWFCWYCSSGMDQLLVHCPDLIVGRYVAVVAFDGSPLIPNEAEVARGWTSRDKVAYSPHVECIDEVDRDNHDEWYVTGSPPDNWSKICGISPATLWSEEGPCASPGLPRSRS